MLLRCLLVSQCVSVAYGETLGELGANLPSTALCQSDSALVGSECVSVNTAHLQHLLAFETGTSLELGRVIGSFRKQSRTHQ